MTWMYTKFGPITLGFFKKKLTKGVVHAHICLSKEKEHFSPCNPNSPFLANSFSPLSIIYRTLHKRSCCYSMAIPIQLLPKWLFGNYMVMYHASSAHPMLSEWNTATQNGWNSCMLLGVKPKKMGRLCLIKQPAKKVTFPSKIIINKLV